MTQAVKVYQIAESLGMDHEIVVAKIRAFGIPVNNKMSKLDGDVAEQIKISLLKDREQDWIEIELPNGVKKRIRRAPRPIVAAPAAAVPAPAAREERASRPSITSVDEAAPPPPVRAEPVRAVVPVNDVPSETATPVVKRDEPSAPTGVAAHTPPEPAIDASAAAPVHAVPAATQPISSPPAEEARDERHEPPAPVGDERPPDEAFDATSEGPTGETPSTPVPRPSTPPPKTGTVVYDPVTKTVTHVQSSTPARPSRSVQVDASRIQPQARGPQRVLPGQRISGPGGRPIPARRPIGRGGLKPPPMPLTQMGAHKRVVKIEGQISLQELARRMSVKSPEVLGKLLSMGMPGVNINSTLDADTAKLLAQEFQYEVSDVAVDESSALLAIMPDFKDEESDYEVRPPVVTVMGHVDHGKTTLLDAILGMRVAEGEAGGITQKVSAYRVETPKGPVVFFDTPGHEAFTKLRARGAETTDVAVLVVAADDGVMPTTVEAIHHAKAANVPIVVAINKIDRPDAKPERVAQQLMEHEIVAEEFGGETIVVKVSAKTRVGIDELLESLALQSEILELRANPKKPGRGTVYDAALDKGRGVVTRVLVQDGTIHTGDVVLTGTAYGKIRAMFDDRGKPIVKAGPSTPVEILGLNEVPAAGDEIFVVQDIKKAQAFADERRTKTAGTKSTNIAFQTFEDIQRHVAAGESVTLGVIIKAEAQGSVEALSKALTDLSTEKIRLHIVHTGIGGITESDINLAVASKTIVIGFNVRPQGKAGSLAESEKVAIRLYNIIYEAVDDMKALMAGQLKPTLVEKALGKADVRQVFNITKVGVVAGCYITEGLARRGAKARLVRDSVQVWEGRIGSLRRFKEDEKEVAMGFECGISLENYGDVKPGDVIEIFEVEEVAAKL